MCQPLPILPSLAGRDLDRYRLSSHAERRCAQRGIPTRLVAVVLAFGLYRPASGDAEHYRLDPRDERWTAFAEEGALGVVVVVKGWIVVTVYRREVLTTAPLATFSDVVEVEQ